MKTTNQQQGLLGVAEAARLLGIRRRRAYDLARRGAIPSVRLGRLVRFSPVVLDEFIRAGGYSPGHRP